MHDSFILQQYVCYTTILNMFRAAPCSSSGGQILLLQPLVSYAGGERTAVRSPPAYDSRGCSNTICPPEDEQGVARNMLRIVVWHTYCWRIKELCIKLVIWKRQTCLLHFLIKITNWNHMSAAMYCTVIPQGGNVSLYYSSFLCVFLCCA